MYSENVAEQNIVCFDIKLTPARVSLQEGNIFVFIVSSKDFITSKSSDKQSCANDM